MKQQQPLTPTARSAVGTEVALGRGSAEEPARTSITTCIRAANDAAQAAPTPAPTPAPAAPEDEGEGELEDEEEASASSTKSPAVDFSLVSSIITTAPPTEDKSLLASKKTE